MKFYTFLYTLYMWYTITIIIVTKTIKVFQEWGGELDDLTKECLVPALPLPPTILFWGRRKTKEDLQDGRGVRHEDHLPHTKYIKNTSTYGTTPTEHLLNAVRRPQTSQKARNSPCIWPCGWQGLEIQPSVRPESLRWESRDQDIGPPETSRCHIMSISKSFPRYLCLHTKTQLHSMTSKLQCWTPHAKQLARQEHNHTH